MSDPTQPSGPTLPGWEPPPGGVGSGTPSPYGPPGSPYGGPPGAPYGSPYAPYGHDPKRRYKRGALIWSALGGLAFGMIIALVLLVSAALAVSNADDSSVSATHPKAGESAEPARVGQCLDSSPPEARVVDQHDVVPCRTLHGSEVIGIVELPASDRYPGRSEMGDFADAACALPFRTYIGTKPDDSSVDLGSIVPDRQAFAAGDRRIWCLINTDTTSDDHRSARGSGE